MNNRKNGEGTRRRILEISSRLFAEKGYRNTVHEEICRLSGANIGAVNYHFRGKEKLYVEAWRQAFSQSLEKYPVNGGVSSDAPSEERLRGRIISFMKRISDPENIEFEIVHREMSSPTGFLANAMKELLDPLSKDLLSLVRELLGEKASERDVHLCGMSIMGQCFNPAVMQKRRSDHHKGGFGPTPLDCDIETIADHVIRFSLAGLHEIRNEIENKGA